MLNVECWMLSVGIPVPVSPFPFPARLRINYGLLGNRLIEITPPTDLAILVGGPRRGTVDVRRADEHLELGPQ